MNNLYSENLITLNLDANSKEEVISIMSDLLKSENRITSITDFKESIYERETESTTEVGEDTAIPHGRSECVLYNSVCISSLKKPVIWNEVTGETVEIIFMLAVKKDSTDTHIEILSDLASKIMEEGFIDKIKSSNNKTEIYKLING
ncbi:MAG: PTS sugar transporter subunit IIA [Sebaldella sp.]|nr:PTS sugar transporter subunit IIA [Sebaldella sp.]